jgi:pseudaminic acid biosynthesis-associated methylase
MNGLKSRKPPTTVPETPQTSVWKGEFGRDYTDRNTCDIEQLDELYRSNYGVTRTAINQAFLQAIPQESSFLEVGCNTGNQLLMLRKAGWKNLSAIELQPYAADIARRRLGDVRVELGSALALPWPADSFDVVFTSGVLIHIAPSDLPRAINEIHRASKKYIWGLEYYAPDVTEVQYRDHSSLLWKMDFARAYLERFDDLELVREQRLPYLDSKNVDTVFLLEKKR